MTQGIEEFSDIIEQLKPLVKEPDFNHLLQQVAVNIPKTKQFLLKMELKRLARPCKRQIDLRGHVDGECVKYEFDGLNHYLDDIAIEVFERQSRIFGAYTQGVYESVINTENNFRVMYQKEQEKLKADDQTTSESSLLISDDGNQPTPNEQYQTQTISFNQAPQRAEERMNFSIPIEIKVDKEEYFRAVTVDISVSGLKIKLSPKYNIQMEDALGIRFVGLENDFALDKKDYIAYQVTRIDRSSEEQRISLKRNFKNANPTFDNFLNKFITGNKRRYKVNMDNTLQAILQKGFEQYYIPHLASIPIYFNEEQGNVEPCYALTNDVNKESIYYWSDEKNQLRIGSIFNQNRIKSLIKKPDEERNSYLYCFNQIRDGKTYFYAALQDELDLHPQLKQTFLAYGSRKASWRIYKIQLTAISPSQCHHPLSLPDTVSENIKRKNQAPAPRLISKLKSLKWMILATDITSEESTLGYQQYKAFRDQINDIKKFGHPHDEASSRVSLHRFKYQNLRKETRFLLRTKVKLDTQDVQLFGVTEDFSLNGIKLEVSDIYTGQMGDNISVSYIGLQKMAKQTDLHNISYKVVHISKDRNVLRLRMQHEDKDIKEFFEELIKSNRNKLKTDSMDDDVPGLGEALRNIYSVNPLTTPVFIKKDGIQFLPESVGKHKYSTPLDELMCFKNTPDNYNLYPLFNAPDKHQYLIRDQLKKLRTHSKPVMFELLISINPSIEEISQAITCKFTEQFKRRDEIKEFIQKAMGAGKFFAVKLFISRTGRPDTDLLHYELSYINAYAVHRAKMIEELLWSISGIVDILDVSEEVMQRYGFLPEHIIVNKQALSHA